MASNAKLLSGKQLLENGAKKSDSFLPPKGAKSVVPSGSWLEKKQIESSLEARKRVLDDQRIEKRGTITKAEWIDEEQKALVIEQKGGQWLHMGQTINSQTYLLPEETLHLMEINSLELKYGGVPVSIQQAYTLLIGKSVSLNEYRVYSLLSKQGYKLIRFDKTRVYAEDTSDCDTVPQVDKPHDKIKNHSDPVLKPLIEKCQLNSSSNNNLETPNESVKLDGIKESVENKEVSSTETNGETVILSTVDTEKDVVGINETDLVKGNHLENDGDKDAVEDKCSDVISEDVIKIGKGTRNIETNEDNYIVGNNRCSRGTGDDIEKRKSVVKVDLTQVVNKHPSESLEVTAENYPLDDMSLENSCNDTSSIEDDGKVTRNDENGLINVLYPGDTNLGITESYPNDVKSNNLEKDISDEDSLEDMCLVYTSDDSDSTDDPKISKKELINIPEKNGTELNDATLEKEKTTLEDMCLEDTSSESDLIEDIEDNNKYSSDARYGIGKQSNVIEINENHNIEKEIDVDKTTLVDMNLVGTSDEADSVEETVKDSVCSSDTNEELPIDATEIEKNGACSTKYLKDTIKGRLLDIGCVISTNQKVVLDSDNTEEVVEEQNGLEKEVNAEKTTDDMCLADTSSESDSIEKSVEGSVCSGGINDELAVDAIEINKNGEYSSKDLKDTEEERILDNGCLSSTNQEVALNFDNIEQNKVKSTELLKKNSLEKEINAEKTTEDMCLADTSSESDSVETSVEGSVCSGDTNEELAIDAIEIEKKGGCSTEVLKDNEKERFLNNEHFNSTNQEVALNSDDIEEDVEKVNSRHCLEKEINAEKTTEDMSLADTSSESDSIETSVEDNVCLGDVIDIIVIEKDGAEIHQEVPVNDHVLEKDKITAEDMCLENSSDETETKEDPNVTKEERSINGKCSGDVVVIVDIEKHEARVDQVDSSEKENIPLDAMRLRAISDGIDSIEVHMEVEKDMAEVNDLQSKKQNVETTADRMSACCMDIDSSSDDCMVVGDSPGEVDNTKGATDVEKPNDTEINIDSNLSNDSDAMEIEYLPSFSFKLKILDAIPNCFRKTILYLKAPDEKFIPPDINLTKRNFIVMLNKLSDKSNMNDGEANLGNYYDEYPHNTRDPTLKCITNFSHEEDVRQTSNSQNNRNFNSHYMGRNNFANNTYFWNHIFHQLSSRQANFFNNFQFPHLNGMFGRVNNFSNNFGQRPSFFPQFNNRSRFSSNFFFQPFNLFCNRPNLFPNSEPSPTFSNFNNSCSSGRDNTFSQIFNNRTNAQSHNNQPHRKHCKNQINLYHKSNPLTPKSSTRKKEKTSEDANSNAPSKETILSHIKALLSRYSIISPNEQSEELRKALKLAVDQFNTNFNENYVLDFKTPQCLLRRMSVNSNRCHEVPLFDFASNTQEPDRVLQVSSDSDCGPVKVSRLNNYSPASDSCLKKKVRRKLRSKRSKSETKLTFQVNIPHSSSDSDDFHSSSEEENGQSKRKLRRFDKPAESTAKTSAETQPPPRKIIKNNIETFSKYKRKVVIDHSNDSSVFGGWFPKKDSWGRPVYSALKPRHSHSHIPAANLKISYAILNNIRELSYEKEYSLESWGQAKKLFERRNDSGTVCISDDESMPNDPADSRLNEITIKIDKIHPLVRPEDCKSVSTVLDRLQVISSVNDDPYFGAVIDESERLKISYDMYLPKFKNFRKSNPPPPAFSIVVLSDTSPMPCPAALSQVAESLQPSVPFLLAVVSFDAVSFVQMEHITLPNMKRNCET